MLGTVPPKGQGHLHPAETEATLAHRIFEQWYAPLLMHPAVKTLTLVWLAFYLGVGLWGCSLLREGLQPQRLLVGDSYAIPHYKALEKYFWPYGPEVQIVVSNPPDLNTVRGRKEAWRIVDAFGNTTYTTGREGLQFWLENFETYLNSSGYVQVINTHPEQFLYYTKYFWLALAEFRVWNSDLKFEKPPPGVYQDVDVVSLNRSVELLAYRFTLGMKNFQETNRHRAALKLLRGIADTMPEYNITTFYIQWFFVDQYNYVLPNTLQNIAIAMVSMVLISLLLIPKPICALWVCLAIASIDVGVVGFMTLWGAYLDAITMITIIMSIGFSVDFSAHVCYVYVKSRGATPADRVAEVMGHVGWPICQGAVSTLLGVTVIAFVDAYMIRAFFKTVFLVISIGAVHGLVFLPVLLSIFVHPEGGGCCKGRACCQ